MEEQECIPKKLIWLKKKKVMEDTKSVSCQVNTTKKLYKKKVSKNLTEYKNSPFVNRLTK